MLVCGALVNALAFSGLNYLSSLLHRSGIEEERKRHEKAVKQLQVAQAEWSRKRTEHLHWIYEEHRRQNHAARIFHDVDEAMREYYRVTTSPLTH